MLPKGLLTHYINWAVTGTKSLHLTKGLVGANRGHDERCLCIPLMSRDGRRCGVGSTRVQVGVSVEESANERCAQMRWVCGHLNFLLRVEKACSSVVFDLRSVNLIGLFRKKGQERTNRVSACRRESVMNKAERDDHLATKNNSKKNPGDDVLPTSRDDGT